jgi:tRNA1(Val) A37 N6-methylase TrmN6
MARNVARLKMGYYPLPGGEAQVLRSLLVFPEHSTTVDPCAGTGKALLEVTAGADVERHGIELDAGRAAAAAANGIQMVQGNTFDAQAKVETFSLLYLNPPYDSEINLTGNRRLERLFLEHTYRWLMPREVLVFVVPYERVSDCAHLLSDNFTRLVVLRLTDVESQRFPASRGPRGAETPPLCAT